VAWRLLELRHLGPTASPLLITRCVDAEQLHLLRILLTGSAMHLPPRSTIREVMLRIALSGHITNNSAPARWCSVLVLLDCSMPKLDGAWPERGDQS
jgi:hypothetical protein